ALEINPNYITAIVDLIAMYEERDSKEQLIKDLEALTQLSPLKVIKDKIVLNCVEIASKNTNHEKAFKYYSKALEYLDIIGSENPELSNLKIQKAVIQNEMGNTPEAIKTLEDAVIEFPENERLLYYLATMYDKNNKKDEALKIMEKILQLNPDNPDALNYIGYSYVDKKINLGKAKELISRALMILPDDIYVMDSMGWAYFSTGDYKNAIIQLERALKLANDKQIFEPEIIEHLMSAYKQAGMNDKIKQTYSDLLNSGIYKDKKNELKTLFEKFNEIPERKPASIDINKK
ncbi:MAG: tetratricopeptide repeat protein, partial [Proteobacteria bacterium]|nr:tetratricopeptide repeat protein [Pseudomonadota bacterium]